MMIRKIFFIGFILLLASIVSYILSFDGEVIVSFFNHEIRSKVGFLLFLSIAILLVLYLFIYVIVTIFYPNINRYRKNEKKLYEKFDRYLDLIIESLVYRNIKNPAIARKKLKLANRLFKDTNMARFVEAQIYYIEKNYRKSEEEFKKINISSLNSDLLNLKMNFELAKKNNDVENMEKYASAILKVEPIDEESLKCLYDIYKRKNNWEEAANTISIIAKAKIFDTKKLKDESIFIYTALGKKYFDKREYFNAKKYLRKAYELDRYYLPSTTLLVETYAKLNKVYKAISVIKKTWKHVTSAKLADLYFSMCSKKGKKDIGASLALYKLNTKSFYSNFILANAYFENKLYNKARKYAKEAENIDETKDLYELMLKIEQNDEGSSASMANLKKKIAIAKNTCYKCRVCNHEYCNWRPQCLNCNGLNTIE